MRWKKILSISALLIIAMIVTVYVILATYDFNKFKPRIIQAVREATGRELTLGGDLRVELGFVPGLSVENVSFQNAHWGSQADMAKVKRFEVQVAILPLIGGTIEVKRFVLVEPDILLETNKSGTTNFEFQTPEKQKTQTAKAPGLIFNEVKIKNGRLIYKDGGSNSSYTLNIDRFRAIAPAKKDPLTVDFQGVFNKKSFEIQATLSPLFSAIKTGEPLTIHLTAKTTGTTVKIDGLVRDPVRAGDLDCRLTAAGSSILNIIDFTGVSGVPDIGPYRLAARVTGSADQLTIDSMDLYAGSENQLRATLSGSLEDLLSMRGIELAFQFRGKDVANLETLFDQPLPLAGAFAVSGRFNDPASDVYRFSDLTADLGDNKITGSVVFDLSGHRSQMTAALASKKLDLSPVSLPASFGFSGGKSSVDLGPFKLFINTVGPFEQLSVEKLDFQAGNENLAKISLQGSVKDLMSQQGIGLNFLIQGKNMANLEGLVDRPIPIKGAFKASGKIVDSVEKTYSFNTLDVRISDSDIRGTVDLNLAGQRPQINASLVSGKINLKPILSNAGQSAPAAIKPAGSATQAKKPSTGQAFPLDVLEAVNANIKIQTGKLLLPALKVNRLVMELLLQDGHLMVSARGPSLPDISQLSGVRGLPRLGPYKISARAREIGGRLSVEELNMLAGKQDIAEIKINAAVNDLIALRGIKGRFRVRGKNIANLAPLVGQSLPVEGRFSAAGNLTAPEINFYKVSNIEIVAGQNDVSGRVDLNLTGKRPQLAASLSSQKLDLRPLLEIAEDQERETKKYGTARDRKNKASAKHQLSVDMLRLADVEFNMHVANLLTPELFINDFNFNLNLQNGRYSVTAETRATPDIAELTGITGLADLGPSKLILKGAASADKLTVEKLDYHAGTQEIFEIKLKGSAEDLLAWHGITSNFKISGNDAASLERFTKQPMPYSGPFSLSGRLTDPSHHVYNFDQVRIVIGDNNLAGWSAINLTGDRPQVKAELTSQKLDLRWLYSDLDPKDMPNRPSTGAGTKRKKVFPNNPLPLDMLKLADLDLKIRAEEILFPRITMRNLTATIILDDEHLTAKPFKFSAGDGSVQGYIDLQAEDEALALETEIDIDQILLGSKSNDIDVSRTWEGIIDAKIKISGRGDSVAALMAGLNGKIIFAHRGGQIANRYFSLFFGSLTNELAKRINVFSQKQEYTEINCFVSHFAINDGLAEHAFVLDTPQSTISASGNINLKTETLDFGFKTSPKKGVKVPGLGKVSLSLGELTKPVKIGGTLAEPSLTVDLTGTAVTFGKVIGGVALGPGALAIVFGDVSPEDIDPCLEAFKAAEAPVDNGDTQEKKKVKKKRWWRK